MTSGIYTPADSIGEATDKWAFREPGFFGSMRQLTCCARCGRTLPGKGKATTRKVYDLFKPTLHFLCDECFDQIPD